LICSVVFILSRGWDGNVEGWGGEGAFCGRQQSKSPETEVSVAGHRGGMVEPKD